MSTAWTSRYALRTKGITSSAIRDLLKITQRPGMISFAGGLPIACGGSRLSAAVKSHLPALEGRYLSTEVTV